MSEYNSTEDYVAQINAQLENYLLTGVDEECQYRRYVNKQLNQLTGLIETISKDNFWQILPQILGIDSKLSIFLELIKLEGLSLKEIMDIADQDYTSYYKELCGYKLNSDPKPSILFYVR